MLTVGPSPLLPAREVPSVTVSSSVSSPPTLHHDSAAGASSHQEIWAIPHSCVSRKCTLLLISPCRVWVIPQKTEGHSGFPSPVGSAALNLGQLWTSSRDVMVGTVPCPPFLLPLLSYGLTATVSRRTLLAFPFMSRSSHLGFVFQVLELSAASLLC